MLRRERSDIGKKMIGYFIGFIMIFSAFGVIFFGFGAGSGGTVKYNGLKFTDKGNFWSVKVNGREALFTYLPDELASLNADNATIEKLKNVVIGLCASALVSSYYLIIFMNTWAKAQPYRFSIEALWQGNPPRTNCRAPGRPF